MQANERLKQLRHNMGLSVAEMSQMLGIGGSPKNAADKVRKMERGASDISGVMLKLITHIETLHKIKTCCEDTPSDTAAEILQLINKREQ